MEDAEKDDMTDTSQSAREALCERLDATTDPEVIHALIWRLENIAVDRDDRMAAAAMIRALGGGGLCEDCPPVGYPTDKTRCLPCPRRSALLPAPQAGQDALGAAAMREMAAGVAQHHAETWRKHMGIACDIHGRGSQQYDDAGLIVTRSDMISDEIVHLPLPDHADLLRQAAKVLLDNMPGEHQALADLQDAVDEGKEPDDCLRAWLRALSALAAPVGE